MAVDYEMKAHLEWLGYLQPVGLVVSPPALHGAQAHVNRNVATEHELFRSLVEDGAGDGEPALRDFPCFTREVLGWRAGDLIGGPGAEPLPERMEARLDAYGETLRPTYAVRESERDRGKDVPPWMLLIDELPLGTPLDEVRRGDSRAWEATPQARFERLLRETGVAAGLLLNGTELRLVYAPRGESTGHLTFPVRAMTEVGGRPIFSALLMLLGHERLFVVEPKQRLTAILADSRKYQNVVSTRLSRQVLEALYELVRGFQAADDRSKGELLRDVLASDPDRVYKGLLTVLLRLVFLLYAEDRGLMPGHEVYVRHYSLGGLFERLRDDAARNPDTMDQRYGSWPQLLTLFRMVFEGARHGELKLPPRRGYLFNRDDYPFLEGKLILVGADPIGRVEPPLVSDGVVYRVLEKLLLLDGERISYRSLDVEQIGSVYETMMGFTLEVARGRSIAVKATKLGGATTTINLDLLLGVKATERAKWLLECTDQKLTGKGLNELKEADTAEALAAALGGKVDRDATPNVAAPGSMVLQPSEERRRLSGSHYTPRALTEPIVRKTLEPVLARFGERPTPEQILGLKTADVAMGSGAFLVETCRQLADELVKAWHAHGRLPVLPPDEDEVLHARRLVAQRCLYGVDRNPMAVDVAKLSLWLATLARDHDFTFLDHALRAGDSLVGLTRAQIGALHWKPGGQLDLFRHSLKEKMDQVSRCRCELLDMDDETPTLKKVQMLKNADSASNTLRQAGDVVVAAYFAEEKDKKREARLTEMAADLAGWIEGRNASYLMEVFHAIQGLRSGPHPVSPLHWEIEFPEVFDRENPGFDAVVGNPPFLGGTIISGRYGKPYLAFLNRLHPESGNRMDLVAYFFRRAFGLIRSQGTLGLIATNTIAQGDTREGGLRWICTHGGSIYSAQRRLRWPGKAAVVVSILHIAKHLTSLRAEIDGEPVSGISAFLFHDGGHESPAVLSANAGLARTGSKIYGQGFLFADDDPECTPLAEMRRLIASNPRNQERIAPYLGGDEVNESPRQSHHRYVINFGELPLEDAKQWPDLLQIVEAKVKPGRDRASAEVQRCPWWQHFRSRPELYTAARQHARVLANSQVSPHLAFAFLPTGMVYSQKLIVYPLPTFAAFCTLQARVHELWARFFSSTMKDDLNYSPSDCFETFPFPPAFEADPTLEAAGRAYSEYRAALMVENDEGLTKTYNRFHDPDERSPKILRLRELHAAMDLAVLDAYGWTDLSPRLDFLLDYEEDGDEQNEGKPSRRKKPWRYRWIDEDRDEVLARLLELNKQRAEQEQLSGRAAGRRRQAEDE